MSARKLRRYILGCSLWLILYAIALAVAEVEAWHCADILEPLIPVALAIPAALLASAFSRRNSYLQALRDLWKNLIPAVQIAIQYTYLSPPNQNDLSRTREALLTAIDMLRGVFLNVKSDTSWGLYPFENLKDIDKIINWLGCDGKFRSSEAEMARKCIIRLWQEMHEAMLPEFDRDVPKTPVSKYFGDKRSVADLLITNKLAEDDLCLKRFASQPRSRPPRTER